MTVHTQIMPFRWRTLSLCPAGSLTESLPEPLAKLCCGQGIKGTLLLAARGYQRHCRQERLRAESRSSLISCVRPALPGMELKYSYASEMPFHRMKVRSETGNRHHGRPRHRPAAKRRHLCPATDWNALISEPTRSSSTRATTMRSRSARFKAPSIRRPRLSRFPPGWRAHREELEGRKIAMFCTGGIRCEKATAYVKAHRLRRRVSSEGRDP